MMVTITQSRFMAAIEGTAAGLALGLIDVHSTDRDWFNPVLTFLITGFVLGLRHRSRSWQAWAPLGWCFYLMHRAAIACGYRPPYVEADADKAILSLYLLWPAGIGLALGAFVRFACVSQVRLAIRTTTGRADPKRSGHEARETLLDAASGSAPSQRSAEDSAQGETRQRFTVGELMVSIALIAVQLAALRSLLRNEPFLGFGTVYAERYSESRFLALRAGMGRQEVEAIMGRPLRVVPWNQHMGPHDEEMWFYSDQPTDTANFYRRWVLFENGKVADVINEFWYDLM